MPPYNPPPDHDHYPQLEVSDYAVNSPNKSNRRWLIIPLVVLIATVVAFGVWKIMDSKKSATQTTLPAINNSQNVPAETNLTSHDVPNVNKTVNYSNGFLGLKLTHPDSWTVTEANNGVRLESPSFNYQTIGKGSVNGYFRIYVRKGSRDIDGKYIGRGVALEPSQKLTYASPAPGQRSDTNLTLFGLDTTDNYGFFMIAGNYSLEKGDTLGPNYGKEAETYVIAGGYSDKSLTDDLATNPVGPDLLKTSNAYKQALDILKSLQLR